MKVIFPSEESINACVDYFKNLAIASPEQYGLFLFFKSLGFNSLEYNKFPKVSFIDEDTRKSYLQKLYLLSGLFDSETENGEKKCCLFPFSITDEIGKKDLYNPGTSFKGLLSRLRDTVDNTLIDNSKFLRKDDSNPDNFKFPKNYISLLKTTFLQDKKISISKLSTWCFRFRGVDCPDEWLNNPNVDIYKAYTRICIKKTIEELQINDEELSELFVYDEVDFIKFSDKKLLGSVLRNKLSFHKDYKPNITKIPSGGISYMDNINSIDIETTEELAQPTGNNITSEKLLELLNDTKQVILYGIPGTSKSFLTNAIKKSFEETVVIQFHASINYEQFIGGITVNDKGELTSKEGIFLSFCENAKKNTDKNYLFVIDEINRGNVSKVFGETILALDRDYEVSLPNSINGIIKFAIPNNVYLLATMNSADRSIAQIDYAIRRRFAFVKFYTNYEIISLISDCSLIPDIKPSILLKSINKALFNTLKDENLLLGHAYFMPKWAYNNKTGKIQWSYNIIQKLMNYYIIPMIEEYTYGNERFLINILGQELPKRINDTELFIRELKKQFKVN